MTKQELETKLLNLAQENRELEKMWSSRSDTLGVKRQREKVEFRMQHILRKIHLTESELYLFQKEEEKDNG